jgi:uncharacterized membrane protein
MATRLARPQAPAIRFLHRGPRRAGSSARAGVTSRARKLHSLAVEVHTMKPARLLGHQVHPMLIVFPLGLLATSLIFDIVHLATDDAVFSQIAYWNMLAGILGGLLAAVFGFWDWLTIPNGTRAKRIGLMHGGVNLVVVILFAVNLWIRRDLPDHVPTTAALVLSFVAVAFALVGGWLGGELVERLGIGVAKNAGPNAPSSLKQPDVDVRHDPRRTPGAVGRT